MQQFRSRLFTRIVPILKEIGLFGPKVQKALGDMGVMGYAEIDVEQLIANDLKVADDFDAKKFVNDAIAADSRQRDASSSSPVIRGRVGRGRAAKTTSKISDQKATYGCFWAIVAPRRTDVLGACTTTLAISATTPPKPNVAYGSICADAS